MKTFVLSTLAIDKDETVIKNILIKEKSFKNLWSKCEVSQGFVRFKDKDNNSFLLNRQNIMSIVPFEERQ